MRPPPGSWSKMAIVRINRKSPNPGERGGWARTRLDESHATRVSLGLRGLAVVPAPHNVVQIP